MEYQKDINGYFRSLIETIDLVLNNDFYAESKSLVGVKRIIENWYSDYKNHNTLINIRVKDLKFLELEITEFFDKYIATEPMSHNYTEILSYCLSKLEDYWKAEMIKGGNKNVRDSSK